ncbi:MAG TPA: DUF1697 domain-containing protein [Candidatus Krumholzibacteria bacterium]|nr:DUF1697 domain-containing protein [Candidatus Krumholzibacteria bacterium]HPD73262.1 DUF1697 domain-containing protein [Candidatus Krumholzibacteria bacterium]HRY40224.1 DUF1697 domain-containing protein [Candidatus Krumholzibacteria bacterium]
MIACAALLRGVNVGRANRIAMADLRDVLESLGHTGVRTLLNSGNAVFQASGGRPERLAVAIEKAIEDRLGLVVPVVVVTAPELERIVAGNPLAKVADDPARYLVAFAGRPAALDGARGLLDRSWQPEALAIGEIAAYLWCANGIRDSKLAQAFDRATRRGTTMRNWITVLKLLAMVDGGHRPDDHSSPGR